jgi:hypothetical protein
MCGRSRSCGTRTYKKTLKYLQSGTCCRPRFERTEHLREFGVSCRIASKPIKVHCIVVEYTALIFFRIF